MLSNMNSVRARRSSNASFTIDMLSNEIVEWEGRLDMNAKTAIPMRHTLLELGHNQPPTPIQTDNTTAVGLATNTIKQKYSKALDMRWHWLQDQVKLRNFDIFFQPGSENKGDYFTKNHSPTHHRQQRFTYLHQVNVAKRGCVDNAVHKVRQYMATYTS